MAQEAQAITFPSKSLLHIANQCFQSGDLGLASAFYSIWDTLLLSGAETISLPRLRQMQIKDSFSQWAVASGYRSDTVDIREEWNLPACYNSIQPGWRGEADRMQARYETGLQLIEAADSSLFYCPLLSKQGRHGTAVYEISRTGEIFIPRPHLIPERMGEDTAGPIMRFHPFVDTESMIAYCNFEAVQSTKIEDPCLFVGGNNNIFHFFYDILGRIVSYQYFEECEDSSNKFGSCLAEGVLAEIF